jgi:hypothetical protein
MVLSEKERDNELRWDGKKRGWYEVYYLKWNDLESRTACWIRYTMTSPLAKVGDPYCELWGIFFDAERPEKNFAVKDRHPIKLFSWDRDRFLVGVGDAELATKSCHGSIKDEEKGLSLSWDLRFDSKGPSYHHFPHEKLYEMSFPKTKVLSPHEDARFSGTVIANGREIKFIDAPGQQTHIWGTKHALRWAWGHCNAFKEDDTALWEGLDSQIKLGPFPSPHLTGFILRYKGTEHLFTTFKSMFTNRSRWELGAWRFEAKSKEIRMAGVVTCDNDEMVAVTYTDPDGKNLWCNNSKVATIKLMLFGPDGKSMGELTSDHGCAAEFVDRRTYPQVPVEI